MSKTKLPKRDSPGELDFAAAWNAQPPLVDHLWFVAGNRNILKRISACRPFERQYRFHPQRQWRFDFAWPTAKVAVEIEGGVHSGGRHTRGVGFTKDCEKQNAAASLGWLVFRFTTDMVKHDPAGCVEQVLTAVEQRLAEQTP